MHIHRTVLLFSAFACAVWAQTVPVSFSRQAEDFSALSPGLTFPDIPSLAAGGAQESRNRIREVGVGDWIRFDSMNFLSGYDSIEVWYNCYGYDGTGKRIEFRVDSATGPVFASVQLFWQNTWYSYPSRALISRPVAGMHSVYITVVTPYPNDPVADIDRFRLFGNATIDPADAKTWYVSIAGSDANDGLSLARPFRTIQKAASVMKPGSRCCIRQGIYRETVRPLYGGYPGAPLTFSPYANDDVYISGTDSVTGWVPAGIPGKPAIFKARMPWSLGEYANQVLVDGEMAYMARSPNIGAPEIRDSWYDYWMGTTYGWQDFKDSIHPVMIPTMLVCGGTNQIDGNRNFNADFEFANVDLPAELLNRPADFFASGILSIHNNWWSTIGLISSSTNVSNRRINFAAQDLTGSGSNVTGPGYVSHVFGLLDAPNEWFFRNDTLYLWAPDNGDPSHHLVEAKRRVCGFDLTGAQWVTLFGLRFIGTSLTMADAHDCVVDKCSFKYISHFDNFRWYENFANYWGTPLNPCSGYKGIFVSGKHNTFQNSSVAVSCGSGIILAGNGHIVRNNRIHDIDYATTYDAGVAIMKREVNDPDETVDLTIEHNTMYNCGRSNIYIDKAGDCTVNPPIRIRYNDLGRCGWLSHEVGSFYTYMNNAPGSEIAYNWFHDVGGTWMGYICFDGGSVNWKLHHNVFWQGRPTVPAVVGWTGIPEPRFNCWFYNNTIIDSNSTLHRGWDVDFLQVRKDGNGGYQMWTTPVLDQWWTGTDSTWPKRYYNNLICYSDTAPWKFTDPVKRDYTLRTGSPAIGRGLRIEEMAAGCDWGAYQHNQPRWVPGADWHEQPWQYPPSVLAAANDVPSPVRPALWRPMLRIAPGALLIDAKAGMEFRIAIFDARGAVAASKKQMSAGTIAVPTHGLGTGMYIVRISGGNNAVWWKTMIKGN